MNAIDRQEFCKSFYNFIKSDKPNDLDTIINAQTISGPYRILIISILTCHVHRSTDDEACSVSYFSHWHHFGINLWHYFFDTALLLLLFFYHISLFLEISFPLLS